MGVGYARAHALGVNGPFDRQLARTRRGSLLNPPQYTSEPIIGVIGNGLAIRKTSSEAMASTYFTSIDRGSSTDKNAMFTSVFRVLLAPTDYAATDPDPVGPVLGLEHGPRNTAVYCFFITDGVSHQIRICGPSVQGVRSPDVKITFDWTVTPNRQYILFWNESKYQVELWTDDTAGAGGIGNSTLISAIPISLFQTFGVLGSIPVGGANDITGIYGIEGSPSQCLITSVATGVDVGFPFVDGARAGGWRSFLDSDVTVGFSGAVDPTRLDRGGAWFKSTSSPDLAGRILPSAGGYCRLLKKTAATNFSVYRDEPGFLKTATDGFILEFKCATDTSGGASTGAAIQISDGQSLFQLDFIESGGTKNIGLLKVGGNPSIQGRSSSSYSSLRLHVEDHALGDRSSTISH
jgi:hypothetical protein